MLVITVVATILAPVVGNPFLDAAQGKQFLIFFLHGIYKNIGESIERMLNFVVRMNE